MIEYLGPIISLYRLLIEGLKSGHDKSKSDKRKEVQRKIIEIQLLLEDIIDNAQEILSVIKKYRNKKKFSQGEINILRHKLYSQHHRLYLLSHHLSDDTSEEIMKLFAPNIRRRIVDLIHIKGGAIDHLIFRLNRSDDIRFVNNMPVFYMDMNLRNWSHDRFIEEGRSYTHQILRPVKKKKISIFERIEEQEGIVSELAECSKELSDFIKSQINIKDVVLYKKEKRG